MNWGLTQKPKFPSLWDSQNPLDVRSTWPCCCLCLSLCNPMIYSPLGCSVHEIYQGRILEWVAISFSRGSSDPRIELGSSASGRFFTTEPPRKPWLHLASYYRTHTGFTKRWNKWDITFHITSIASPALWKNPISVSDFSKWKVLTNSTNVQ